MTERIKDATAIPPVPAERPAEEPPPKRAPAEVQLPEPNERARTIGQQSRPDGPIATSPATAGRITPVALASARGVRPAAHGFAFADGFTVTEVMTNPVRARDFVSAYVAAEAPFFGIARNPRTGLTYDGVNLDPRTGNVVELRPHSAPSKECLDIGLLIKALGGDARAVTLLGAGGVAEARDAAAAILEQKLDSYERFYRNNPGYGGFLPWFQQPGGDLRPTDDWVGDLPGLDNGEWLWSLLLAEKALRDQGFGDLAERYGRFNASLQESVTRLFFDADAGKVRADVHVVDPSDPASEGRTIVERPGRMTYLTGEHGVHEGIMMVLYLTLFGRDLPPGAADTIWDGIDIERVEHRHGTTWRAFWGSSHESWAYLFLPFRDLPEMRQLFRLREIIRTQNASERGYPGFGTSTNRPGPDGWTGYLSASGIEGIGSQPVENNDVCAIYGAFPLLLEHAGRDVGNVGLAWLLNMLRGPRAQGPWGAGESVTNDGRAISPCKTIDGSFPNLLAIMGGLEREAAEMLRERGVYERFIARMTSEMRAAFGVAPLREPSAFALPSVEIPRADRPAFDPDAHIDANIDDLYEVDHQRVTMTDRPI